MNTVIIGFGSNIEPSINIHKAKEFLGKDHTILSESKFVRTKPIGCSEQPDFVNGAVLIETGYSLEELKAYLRNIEVALGRNRGENKFAPRTIDLDIIVWNDAVRDQDFYERKFIKDAVLELKPDLKF